MQLLSRLVYPVSVCTVHDKDQSLSTCNENRFRIFSSSFVIVILFALTCVVVPPQGSDFILATDVPHVEFDILVRDRLHVEAHRRNCGYRLA